MPVAGRYVADAYRPLIAEPMIDGTPSKTSKRRTPLPHDTVAASTLWGLRCRCFDVAYPFSALLLAVLVAAAATAFLPSCYAESSEQPDFLVAAMRVQPKRWDKQYNFDLLEHYARLAQQKGAKMVVTCEGFLDGYTGNKSHSPETTRDKYFEIGEPLDGPWMRRIAELAKDLEIFIAVGFSERRADRMYNSLAIHSPAGELVLHYSKTHTSGEAYNTPGDRFPVASTDLGVLGALICYDRRFPEVPRILALKGAEILIVPAYGSDGERNEALLRTRAWENSVWVVYVKQDQALIIRPNGHILARDSGDGDELVFARIELGGDMGDRDILQRRAPELYHEIIELSLPSEQRSTDSQR